MILFLRSKKKKDIKQDPLVYKIWVSTLILTLSFFQRKWYHINFLRLIFFSLSGTFESQLFNTIFIDYKYFYFPPSVNTSFSANITTLHKCFLRIILVAVISIPLWKLFTQFFLVLPHEILIPQIYSTSLSVMCISVLYTQKEFFHSHSFAEKLILSLMDDTVPSMKTLW